MSLAELKQSVIELTAAERRQLSAFLLQLNRETDPAWRQTVTARMRDMDTGKAVPQAEFEQRLRGAKA